MIVSIIKRGPNSHIRQLVLCLFQLGSHSLFFVRINGGAQDKSAKLHDKWNVAVVFVYLKIPDDGIWTGGWLWLSELFQTVEHNKRFKFQWLGLWLRKPTENIRWIFSLNGRKWFRSPFANICHLPSKYNESGRTIYFFFSRNYCSSLKQTNRFHNKQTHTHTKFSVG